MRMILRALLGLTGLILALIGLNTAFGGMATLGWQFPRFDLPDTSVEIARHDSNARFFAATFSGMAIAMALAAWRLKPFASVAIAFLLAIALGGLSRLLHPGYSPISDLALLPSYRESQKP